MQGLRALKQSWFFVGIAVMVAVAFLVPGLGSLIQHYNLLNLGIFLVFLLTGLSLETARIFEQMKEIRVLVAALVSSLILFPLVAYYLGRSVFAGWPDFAIGVLILGVAPVTVASGTIMTAMAGGNVTLSLFICVLANFSAIISIPIMLKLILAGNAAVQLPLVDMLFGLSLKVLLPLVIGQFMRPWLKDLLPPFKASISIFNQCVILLIILNAVSSSAGRILEAGTGLFHVMAFMLALHGLMLLVNALLSRLIGLDLASTAAFTIHTSQKTLTISYLVWTGYFAAAYPMALIPSIGYHLVQMILGTYVAHWFRRQTANTL